MLTRLLSASFGMGAGLVVGAAAVRRFDAVAEAVAPGNVGGAVGRQLASFGRGVLTGVHEARELARLSVERQRRDELRTVLAEHAAARLAPGRPSTPPPHVIDMRDVHAERSAAGAHRRGA